MKCLLSHLWYHNLPGVLKQKQLFHCRKFLSVSNFLANLAHSPAAVLLELGDVGTTVACC